ncbi:sensor histidine kinase [Lysobacter sp. A3-1-A15]|uniref:sensor histidine kinase n=1 Tax=Novilysobacter viscosus TaxID=3098602 RepID=UPI002ED9075B
MRLSEFINDYMDRILAEWDRHALTMTPAADAMSLKALRNHAEQMLRAVAVDIETRQTEGEQRTKSLGGADDPDPTSPANVHGTMRHASDFTLMQLNSEFRALRASVLHLWREQHGAMPESVLDEVMRFNEAIDQALAESILTFSERADHARDMFDAILGHDLRGPLSSMTAAGEILTRTQLREDKAVELGHRVKRAARYMTAMVNDLLEFARTRLGADTLPVRPETVNLAEVCSEAIHDAAAMHPECEFELVLGTRLEACVDPDRVHQLLVNLLGNAGQHGTPGRPVQMHVAGDDTDVALCVINEGRQIPEESLQRIFDPMMRLKPGDDAAKGVTASLGLGLHVAREIALAHGGSITADSSGGQNKFTVRLPRQGPGQRQHGSSEQAATA